MFIEYVNILILIVLVLIYIKEIKFMTIVDDIKAGLTDATAFVAHVDTTLDTILAKIQALQGGQPATQEQLQEILDLVNGLKAGAAAIDAEAAAVNNA